MFQLSLKQKLKLSSPSQIRISWNRQDYSTPINQNISISSIHNRTSSIIHSVQDQKHRRDSSCFSTAYLNKKAKYTIIQPYRITSSTPHHYRLRNETPLNFKRPHQFTTPNRKKTLNYNRKGLDDFINQKNQLLHRMKMIQTQQTDLSIEPFNLRFCNNYTWTQKNIESSKNKKYKITKHKFDLNHSITEQQSKTFIDALVVSKLDRILSKRAFTSPNNKPVIKQISFQPKQTKKVFDFTGHEQQEKNSLIQGWVLELE